MPPKIALEMLLGGINYSLIKLINNVLKEVRYDKIRNRRLESHYR